MGIINKNALNGQTVFQFADMGEKLDAYEYAALVTNMDAEILTIGSHYRDRADSENNFDEFEKINGDGQVIQLTIYIAVG